MPHHPQWLASSRLPTTLWRPSRRAVNPWLDRTIHQSSTSSLTVGPATVPFPSWRAAASGTKSSPDAGIFDAMSKGVQMASGEFVHILNADDRYAHSFVLSKVLAAMTAHGWDLCHARAAQVTANGRVVRVIGRELDKRQLLKKMRVAHPTVIVRRAVYERYGAFSVGFRVAGDYEFLLRIWDQVRVGFVDEVLVHMAIGGNSTRPENLVRSYRESLAAAVIHGAHPAPATIRCWYESRNIRCSSHARIVRRSRHLGEAEKKGTKTPL